MACRGAAAGVRDGLSPVEALRRGATDRELTVVAAVLAAGSEKAAAHRLGLSHSTVKHHLANARSKVGGDHDGELRVYPGRAVAGAEGRRPVRRMTALRS